MPKYCPECGAELINPDAEICPTCGGRLKPVPMPEQKKNPVIALILSIIVTGLGQVYNDQLGKGILYFVIALICGLLIFVLIGIILLPIWWIVGIVDAYKTAELINQGKDASGFINI
ncbi:TM2 domain-containing membrane protein YozV [Methanolinea mesophila]|uniref:zinc ribbon domain-containing protein n=1 Tax=Methanolinea mesophila TaxID=547055 RepID=UPI001AE472FE|nr:zinc ribbon domain-containing protein [Methanolinea mesophila]MBP1928900.1 TM2 domain-containing membrane protein YozV [Methanolinea mesophila]